MRYVIILILFFILSTIIIFPWTSHDTITTQINNTDREVRNEKSVYMVYTTKEVFTNRDCFQYLKFNSADVQNKLQPGKTYKLEVYGWRIPLFSMFRNIIGATQVQMEQTTDPLLLIDDPNITDRQFRDLVRENLQRTKK